MPNKTCSLFTLLILTFTFLTPTISLLCSAYCNPNQCTSTTKSDCTTSCPDNLILTTTCGLDPASGYTLIAQSQDITGSASPLTISPSTMASCGTYTYAGDYTCSQNFTIAMPGGIGVPHYQFQLFIWVLLLNDSTWTPTNNLYLSAATTTLPTPASSYSSQQSACNGITQTYYRMVWTQPHINQTSAPISITLSSDITNGDCLWGMKEAVIMAKKCDTKCLTCNGSANTQCYSCSTGYYLSGNTCDTTCLAGYTSNPPTSLCSLCATNCASCNVTSSNCTSCDSSYYLYSNTCVTTCPNQTYPSTSPSQCLSCHPTCYLCTGNLNTQCQQCTSSPPNQAYLLGSTCYSTCPNGTVAVGATHTCVACPANCQVCSSNVSCSVCDGGYGVVNGSCYSPCPTGYYLYNGTTCSLCDAKCTVCTSDATTCTSCTTTGPNTAYLHNNTCVAACPNGTYATTSPNQCSTCNPKCSICTGPAATQCSACQTGYVLSGNTCDAACLASYGLSATAGVCILCDNKCVSCYLLYSNCSSCVTSGTYQAYLDSTTNPSHPTCTTTCPSSTFPAPTHICQPCNPTCLTCAITATNCTSCAAGSGFLNNSCYSPCPGTYFLAANNSCSTCNGSCTLCNNTSTNCSQCSSGYYLLNFACINPCPNPYFKDNSGSSGVCSSCNLACASCLDGTNTSCSACTANYTLSNSTCHTSCLEGYGVSTTPQLCIACDSLCLVCYITATNCTQCNHTNGTMYLYQHSPNIRTCVSVCPDGTYANSSTLTCQLCPTGCSKCANYTYCYQCNSTANYAWINTTYLCYNPCPISYYKQNTTNCSRCNVQCRQCVNQANNCTQCQPNGTERSYLYNYTCYFICPSPYYGNNGSNLCQPCDNKCAICFNATKNDCLLCQNGYYQSGTTCDNTCKNGYGLEYNSPGMCVQCDQKCKQCQFSSTNCSLCQNSGNYSSYLYNNYTTYSECLLYCPDGYYQASNHTCTPCHSNCLLCQNTYNNCSQCINGTGLLNFTCFSPCPDGYFLNGSLCSPCHPKCFLCSGVQTNCSLCIYNNSDWANRTYLLNNTCRFNCPTSYYKTNKYSGTTPIGPSLCQPCQPQCYQCSSRAYNCTVCVTGYYMYNGNTCVTNCPIGFFEFNATMTCNDSSLFSAVLKIDMHFTDTTQSAISILMNFSHPLNMATFPYQTFQSISFSQSFSMSLLTFTYAWQNNHSYLISIKPTSFIYLKQCKVTLKTMTAPTTYHYSADGVQFYYANYDKTASLTWDIMGDGSFNSQSQKKLIQAMSQISDNIQEATTAKYAQQFNKAGLVSLLLPGAQITSSIIVTNSIFSQKMYEGARIWGSFIYFQVPKWQQEGNKTKYLFVPDAQNASQPVRRRLFDVGSINWRYERTGFTSIFLFDCYVQLILLVFCWVMVVVGRQIQQKCRKNIMSKIYPIFHALHQIMLFYFAMGLILQLIYFTPSSFTRIFSLIIAILANVYFLAYTLYIYYSFMRYPHLQMGSKQYRDITLKLGSFIRNIRYEEYQMGQGWHPRQIFRPYNYHLLAYYKKVLMIVSIPLFMEYPSTSIGVLLGLQVMEIIRFCLTWPYVSKKRNIFRLFLQVILLLFFVASLMQCLLMAQIQTNNPQTLQPSIKGYKASGWIGLLSIFLFNILCFLQLILTLIFHCRQSNRQAIREIRRNYYYQKVVKYEQSLQCNIGVDVLDQWVNKGDLNQKWIQDQTCLVNNIKVTLEKYMVNCMGEGFLVQINKIGKIYMGTKGLEKMQKKVKVQQQIKGSVTLTKNNCPLLYSTISKVYQKYDPNFQSDFLTIRTVLKLDPSKYKQGEQINLQNQYLTQVILLDIPFDRKQTYQVQQIMQGFPVSGQLLKMLVPGSQEETI